ncbi:MAG: ATP-binding cassette domain-containing protein, partial [Phycisphaerae bacterium]
FLDEPLAGLDQPGTEKVIAVLRALASAHRLTLVIVEHVFNVPAILDFATAVWTLAAGHLTRETVTEDKTNPVMQNTNLLSNLIREMAGPEAIITNEQLSRGAKLTRVSRVGTPREPLLIISGLIARRGHRLVIGQEDDGAVNGFDLVIHKGELVFLQAPNGWGKTALLEALAGTLPCQGGRINLGGVSLESKPVWGRRRSGLAVVPARDSIFNSLTIAEYQRICAGAVEEDRRSAICEGDGPRRLSSLSGGERKRLVQQTATQAQARVRIWDEPFSSLDALSVRACLSAIAPAGENAALLLIPSMHVTEAR